MSESSSEDVAAAVRQASVVRHIKMRPPSPELEPQEEPWYTNQLFKDRLSDPSHAVPEYEAVKGELSTAMEQMNRELTRFGKETNIIMHPLPALDPPCNAAPRTPVGIIVVPPIDPDRDSQLAHERELLHHSQLWRQTTHLREAMQHIAMQCYQRNRKEQQLDISVAFSRQERGLLIIEAILKTSPLHEEMLASNLELQREEEEARKYVEVEGWLRKSLTILDPPPIVPRQHRLPKLDLSKFPTESRFLPIQEPGDDNEQLNSPDSGHPQSPSPVSEEDEVESRIEKIKDDVNDEINMINSGSTPLDVSMCSSDDDCTQSQCSTSRESSPLMMADALTTECVKREMHDKILELIGEGNVVERKRREYQLRSVEISSPEPSPSPPPEDEDNSIDYFLSPCALLRRLQCVRMMLDPDRKSIQEDEERRRAAVQESVVRRKTEEDEAAETMQARIAKRHEQIAALVYAQQERLEKAEEERKRKIVEEYERQHQSQEGAPLWQQHTNKHELKKQRKLQEEQQRQEQQEAARLRRIAEEEERTRMMEQAMRIKHEKARLAAEKKRADDEAKRIADEAAEAKRIEEEARIVEEARLEALKEAERQRIQELDRATRKAEQKRLEEEEAQVRKWQEEEEKRKEKEKLKELTRLTQEAAMKMVDMDEERRKFEEARRQKERDEKAEARKREQKERLEEALRRKEEEDAKRDLSIAQRARLEEDEKKRKKEELEASVALSSPSTSVAHQPQRMSKTARKRAAKRQAGARLRSAESMETLDSRDSYENEETGSENGNDQQQPECSGERQEKFEIAASRIAKKKNQVKYVAQIYEPPQPEVNEDDRRENEKRNALEAQLAKEERRKELEQRERSASREITPDVTANGDGEANRRTKYKREKRPQFSEEFLEERRLKEESDSYWANLLFCICIVIGVVAFFAVCYGIYSAGGAGKFYNATANYFSAKKSFTKVEEELPDLRQATAVKTNITTRKEQPKRKEQTITAPVRKPDFEADDPPEMTGTDHCLLWVFKAGVRFSSTLCLLAPAHYRLSTYHNETLLTLANQVGATHWSSLDRRLLAAVLEIAHMNANIYLDKLVHTFGREWTWDERVSLKDTFDDGELFWMYRIPDILSFLYPRLQMNPLANERFVSLSSLSVGAINCGDL